jgi:hypothetical protein
MTIPVIKYELQNVIPTTTTGNTTTSPASTFSEGQQPELAFTEISYKLAIATVVREHYLHRKCPVSFAFGAYLNEELVGVLTVGCPASWSLKAGLVGLSYKQYKNNPNSRANDVFELNRLWMRDDLPRNSESRFIGSCLRKLRKLRPSLILVSYADSSLGHVGWVYQATNFVYTGTNVPFKDIFPAGLSDCRKVPLAVRGEKVGNRRAWALDPTIPRRVRSAKHRYVWCANLRDHEILAYAKQPYPKQPANHTKKSSVGTKCVATETALALG